MCEEVTTNTAKPRYRLATLAKRQVQKDDPLVAERVVHDIGTLISYCYYIKVGQSQGVQKSAKVYFRELSKSTYRIIVHIPVIQSIPEIDFLSGLSINSILLIYLIEILMFVKLLTFSLL